MTTGGPDDRPYNVLISSAGRRVSLLTAFRQSLTDLGLSGRILATDMSRSSAARWSADSSFDVPPCSDPGFVPALLEICDREQVRLIVPTIDTELQPLTQHSAAFRALGTVVAVSGPVTIEIGFDKVRTHAFLHEAGLPTVPQSSVKEAPGAFDPLVGAFVVKPRWGSAGEGVRTVEDLSVLPEGEDLIVQALATGHEYTIDALIDGQGDLVCVVPRRRLEVRAGEVSKGMTVRHPLAIHVASRLCAALPDAYGAITIQMFVDDEAERVNVIEINPRFGGGFPLTFEAGAVFPEWLIEDAMGRRLGSRQDSWREGVVMLRFDDAIFIERSDIGL